MSSALELKPMWRRMQIDCHPAIKGGISRAGDTYVSTRIPVAASLGDRTARVIVVQGASRDCTLTLRAQQQPSRFCSASFAVVDMPPFLSLKGLYPVRCRLHGQRAMTITRRREAAHSEGVDRCGGLPVWWNETGLHRCRNVDRSCPFRAPGGLKRRSQRTTSVIVSSMR
jgi:hypothetical protein